jgi:hypothetical protein
MSLMKLGKCRWCDDRKEIYCDSSLCEDCDGNVIRCSICRTDQHEENHCRHVFQDEWFEWRGAGIAPQDANLKLPFHRLLSAMGEEFAIDLRSAIKSGRFYTWMVAPLIGGGGSLTLNGMPERDGRWMTREWGNMLIDIGESERAAQFHDGYRWLVSLYKTNTRTANRTTIEWIDQWRWPFTPIAALTSC